MSRIDTRPYSLDFSAAPTPNLDHARRFLVPVPDDETDLSAITRRVSELATAARARVKFLGLCGNSAEELSLRRKLATASALVNSDTVSAEAEVIVTRNWLEAVSSRWQPGDVVVCWYERPGGSLRKPLSQILNSDSRMPLYILSDLEPASDRRSGWLARAAAWAGSLAILIGFLAIQVRVEGLPGGWASGLQVVSIPVEIGLIWAWNSLFG